MTHADPPTATSNGGLFSADPRRLPPVAVLRSDVEAVHRTLTRVIVDLREEDVRRETALPGWTRAHLLRHLADLAQAFTRQVQCARAGRRIAVYDGGRAGRDASITAGAALPAQRLVADAVVALQHLETAFGQVGDEEWALPCSYRDGTLHDVLLAWWREVHIHGSDLDLPTMTTEQWPPALCWHLLAHLGPRLPQGRRVTLKPDGTAGHVTSGVGPTVRIRGRLQDLAVWLSGRRPPHQPTAVPAPLPDLGLWP
ncbi:maleylpyruvate isomerase [Kineococcus xinjiangensis]|uniref:Maleylpyruvate isomerase n=1 Tax=Kineococcus xinjiangensis TaxID=512762 RepID=A0A2S6IVC0_9ACTN|nr:maleylpyruvate isomerase family mycothiol-dependent enzyme [Kineococcus xinjiangensis]PPK98312.1 maleylpyruvate isomerase [Kineococcus xinjiangensis]